MATATGHRPIRSEPLSRADLTWLHADTPRSHFIVTSLALLDASLQPDRFRRLLDNRVWMHPRLMDLAVRGDGVLAGERWVRARHFDLDAHIQHVALPGLGGPAELARYVSDLAGRPLDMGRPLWEAHTVEGRGIGGALVTRFHHSLGDGPAMVRMLLSLTDATRGGWKQPYAQPRARRRRARSVAGRPNPIRLARQAAGAAGTLARLTLLDRDPETPLRGELTYLKRVAWSDPIPLDDVKRVARATGTTVNDVIVSAIAAALGDVLEARGEPRHGLRIRAMVPVSLRPANDVETTGNRFSLVFLELPVGELEPRERLMRVKIEMDRLKSSLEPAVGWLLVQGLGFLPARLERLTSRFYADKASLVLTNVIGPREPRYIAGSRIRQMTFWEPESGGLGVGVSIYSYAGKVTIGAISDRNLIADPSEIAEGAAAAFTALARAVARG
ncbi:MAG TPA: wax ester/triacylglycerol synthase family O-acyltransferase [Candidatus Dormibacteraeota bacterium]|nr:wax ester/triacylglycerol synthase family O-acyltransferase [Candidatus Dormibacteraeota bacterium]